MSELGVVERGHNMGPPGGWEGMSSPDRGSRQLSWLRRGIQKVVMRVWLYPRLVSLSVTRVRFFAVALEILLFSEPGVSCVYQWT